MVKIAAMALVLLASVACAGPRRIAQTTSGKPEVIIANATVQEVTDCLVNIMASNSFFLESQSTNSLFFTRAMEGGQAIFAQMAIGNSYSTTPKAEVRFALAATSSGVRVIGYPSMSTQMALGQVNRHDMSGNNAWWNDFQQILQAVKAELEQPRQHALAADRASAVR